MVTPKIPLLASMLLLSACEGPNQETLLDELRVLAMLPEAPEIAPGETTTLMTRVVDPLDQGSKVLVWSCTFLGETCLEDTEGRSPTVAEPTEGWVETAVTASASLASVASTEPLSILSVWALACEDGLCPLIDEVEGGATITPETWADPFSWMEGLPMEGVSLAFTTLAVSIRPQDERHVAPSLQANPAAPTIGAGGEIAVDAEASGELGEEAKVWAYAEAGGFSDASQRLDTEGRASFTWTAPDVASTVPVYLVLVDGLGGSALWEGSLGAD